MTKELLPFFFANVFIHNEELVPHVLTSLLLIPFGKMHCLLLVQGFSPTATGLGH
ncbi:hypothetical protein [Sporosarcina sp. Te-1]|uniref:hypothetical protein n=1 Tax=Sporosarcina sp. Te-1 TaxID=2818390 RepID=UPI001A9ED65D|nr:hypothetical protein [Sporosarcina sp. Te-1]QTD42732.1 hypothetical protein J3U78_08155 [Sporosarcina sp. Te-1]